MKTKECKPDVRTVEIYVAPALRIVDVTVDQNILAGSGDSTLSDMQGEYW